MWKSGALFCIRVLLSKQTEEQKERGKTWDEASGQNSPGMSLHPSP